MNWDTIKGANGSAGHGQGEGEMGQADRRRDLTAIAGKKDQLVGKLQERYGYEKGQAERELDEFARTLDTP